MHNLTIRSSCLSNEIIYRTSLYIIYYIMYFTYIYIYIYIYYMFICTRKHVSNSFSLPPTPTYTPKHTRILYDVRLSV